MLLNFQEEQTSTQGRPPQRNYPPKITYGKLYQPVRTNPFQDDYQQLCYLCAIATMKVLNQDVCIPITSKSTLAISAITTLKYPTSIIKPCYAPKGPGLHIDSTQLYIDSEHEDSEPINYASHDQHISFMWLHTCDWYFIFTYNIVRIIHTATVACFLWLVDTVCMASLYCTYTHKLHIWYALTNMIMCLVWSLIATPYYYTVKY